MREMRGLGRKMMRRRTSKKVMTMASGRETREGRGRLGVGGGKRNGQEGGKCKRKRKAGAKKRNRGKTRMKGMKTRNVGKKCNNERTQRTSVLRSRHGPHSDGMPREGRRPARSRSTSAFFDYF